MLSSSITTLSSFKVAIVYVNTLAHFLAKKYLVCNSTLTMVSNFYKSNDICYKDIKVSNPLEFDLDLIINHIDATNMLVNFVEAINSLDVSGELTC